MIFLIFFLKKVTLWTLDTPKILKPLPQMLTQLLPRNSF